MVADARRGGTSAEQLCGCSAKLYMRAHPQNPAEPECSVNTKTHT